MYLGRCSWAVHIGFPVAGPHLGVDVRRRGGGMVESAVFDVGFGSNGLSGVDGGN